MDALKTLSVTCTVSQWKPAKLRQNWSINTFSKKDPSTLQCTAQQSVSKVLHLSIFSSYQTALLRISQSSEDGEILHEPFTVPSISLLAELSLTTLEKTTDGVFLHRKKRTSATHVLGGSTCAFCFFLVCLLTHCWKTAWGGVGWGGSIRQFNWTVCVCITCAGMETVWKDPTAPQTCKH